MSEYRSAVLPTKMIQVIRQLPFGSALVFRIYNRLLMHFAPKQLATTFFGMKMRVDVRDFLQSTIYHFGTWEANESRLLVQLIRPGDTVLDIGANVGFHSLLFARSVGPDGRVIAIEAHPRLVARVEEQLRLNDVRNVRIVNVAVSDEVGEILLYEGPTSNSGATSIVASRGTTKSITVPAAPIMSLLTPEEIASISLIKIDIEGAEAPVLRDLLDHIDEFPQRLAFAVEADGADDSGWPTIFERFLASGFSAARVQRSYDWRDFERQQFLRPEAIQVLPAGVSDILFVRDETGPAS